MCRSVSLIIFLMLSVLLTLCSCSVTRRVPHGQYLLSKNVVETDGSTPKRDRIKVADVDRFIQPKPNRRLLGTNIYLQLYNLSNPDTTKKGWWNRVLRRMGDPPILVDSVLVEKSAQYINNYAVYSGFYNAQTSFRVDTLKRKKARVVYTIKQGTPYRIGNVNYEFRDEFIRPIILQDSAATLIKSGNLLDGKVLTSEKVRISDYLKNNGYYAYTMNNIEFVGDSTVNGHVVDLTVIFKQNLSGYDAVGRPIFENNSIYRIKDIFINPDYDAMKATSDPDYYTRMDTVEFRGLNVIYPNELEPKVRRKILRKTINLYPNYLYSSRDVQQAYSNIMRLGYYKNASIVFENVEDDPDQDNQVTYIGDDEGSGQTTSERYMMCHINCIPSLTHSYKIELEGTTSSNYYGIMATVGYQNRNLLRGVELFDASVRGGYEFTRVKGRKGAFEIGGTLSLSFPRFITPVKVDRFGRRVNPRTKVEMSINSQRRPNYHRTLSSANWGYSWSNRHKSTFTLKPIDINLIKMNYIDSTFIKDHLTSDYLVSSFRDRLVAGISGSFTYNTQMGRTNIYTNSLYFRFNWETAGNLISGLSRLFDSRYNDKGLDQSYYRILGIRYAQYFRMDASVSNKIMLGGKSNFAYRFLAGVGLPYGNDISIPFDRHFYSGGGNSMRGWIARTLGPGEQKHKSTTYPSQTGNMKLEVNAEFRFPVWSLLHGAVFFDVGNVWFMRRKDSPDDDSAVFYIDKFYKQLGFNTGLGFRVDIGMAVIRFDWGMRVHDPNLAQGERWIKKFQFSNTVLNFGVGYPF